jgi:DNA-binding IclR family transcriptional regulator
MKPPAMAAESQLLTGRRALGLIELLARARAGLSFSSLETETRTSAASLARLLSMLVDEGWIQRNPVTARYRGGSRLLRLGHSLRGHWSDAEMLEAAVARLARATGHSACFARFGGDYFYLAAKTEMQNSYHYIDVFDRNTDFIENAMGVFLLAYQDDRTIKYVYTKYFAMELPLEHKQIFEKIRAEGSFVRCEGVVTRIMAAVAGGADGSFSGLISIAALDPGAIDTGRLLAQVKAAAVEAQASTALAKSAMESSMA